MTSLKTYCQFCEKECPLLNKNVPRNECPLVIEDSHGSMVCAVTAIAINLNGIYQILMNERGLIHKWLERNAQ